MKDQTFPLSFSFLCTEMHNGGCHGWGVFCEGLKEHQGRSMYHEVCVFQTLSSHSSRWKHYMHLTDTTLKLPASHTSKHVCWNAAMLSSTDVLDFNTSYLATCPRLRPLRRVFVNVQPSKNNLINISIVSPRLRSSPEKTSPVISHAPLLAFSSLLYTNIILIIHICNIPVMEKQQPLIIFWTVKKNCSCLKQMFFGGHYNSRKSL